jgi:hypothetical protein
MKNLLTRKLVLVMVLLASTGLAHSRFKSDSGKVCLEVVGVALDEQNEPINGVEVKLLKENEEMEWVEVTSVTYHDHDFAFALEADSYYTIEIRKEGFVTRSVGISTKLPEGIDYTELFKYGFEVTLFKETKGVDDFYLDFPVALVSYNPKSEVFENNLNYTRHIKAKIKESEMTEQAAAEKK